MNRPTQAIVVNTFLTGANCGAFAMRVALGVWDAVNVAVLIAGLLWFAWICWAYRRVASCGS